MDRRTFFSTLTGGLLAAPLAAEAQQGKVWRIGWLSPAADRNNPIEDAFYRSMQELGYTEGRNLLVERRYTAGRPDQWAGAAAEVVRLNVDLIVVWTPVWYGSCKKRDEHHTGCLPCRGRSDREWSCREPSAAGRQRYWSDLPSAGKSSAKVL